MTRIFCGSDGKWTNKSSSTVIDSAALNGDVYEICPARQVDSDQSDWIVFQRRVDGSVDFYRDWMDYRNGFGDEQGELWLGLEVVRGFVQNGDYELRIDMENYNNEKRFAQYSTFSIGDEASEYTLSVSGYSGDAGDSFSIVTGYKFSTRNNDNDESSHQCADEFKGAWWYRICNSVLFVNLNGLYFDGGGSDQDKTHMHWPLWTWGSYTLRKTEMKIRRK